MALGRLSAGAAAAMAGFVAAIAPPLLVLGLDQPIGLGIGIGFGAAGALYGVLGALRGGNAPAPEQLADGRHGAARELIAEGQAALDRLRATGRNLRDELMREEIRLLAMKADRVLREARADPNCAVQVRRLFTFYLPNAASVAEGWRTLENKHVPDRELEGQTRQTMAALNDAFTRFAEEMHEPRMQALDLDLRVLNNALKDDLEVR